MLYQINTRVWIRRFGPKATLADVPETYWRQLAKAGIRQVWLMGVWQNAPEAAQRYALVPGLREEYSHALPDWSAEADVIGSPYAIDCYELLPSLGPPEALALTRARLHELGMKLILDFVPNHFHAETRWLALRPEVFLEVSAEWRSADSATFYESAALPGRAFAHGKDPNFAAWQDTIQVDYSHPAAHHFMREQLLAVAAQCDGLRCDMAMLPLNEVFARTWGFALPARPALPEFWPGAIEAVKELYPGFVFIAEVYWDMEWNLQQQGFDYTYDKRLLDRLKQGQPEPLHLHLNAELPFQLRSVRFLENHDEERISGRLSQPQAQAAAVIAYTIPGLSFFHDGQWEGRRVRLPVQLGRAPEEAGCSCVWQAQAEPGVVCACAHAFYRRLLALISEPVQQQGHWTQLPGRGLLAWHWQHPPTGAERLVAVNYQPTPLRAPWPGQRGRWRERFSGQEWVIDDENDARTWYPYQYAVLDVG